MKECHICFICWPDENLKCPNDGGRLTPSAITGDTLLDGRYQLESRIGQGGMGVVYKARHIYLKNYHAVKVILPDLVGSDPMLLPRFRQEAVAAAAIRHQNIVQVTDFGVLDGVLPFLVMEYVKGRPLQTLLDEQGRLLPAQALALITPVAAGVGAAHRQGIIHRDLKPLNILIGDDALWDNAIKVADFGLAKIRSKDLLGSMIDFRTQGLVGSPYYMAPEQWEDHDVDHRVDLYSLGIILYQLLSGHVPFRANSIPAVMRKHLLEPPSPDDLLKAKVPPEVIAVVDRALQKHPEERFPDADSFIAALKEAVDANAAQLPDTLNPYSSTMQDEEDQRRKNFPSAEQRRQMVAEAIERERAESSRHSAPTVVLDGQAERARQQAEEAARQRKAEEQRRAAEEARRQAEAEARRRAEEQERRRAEEKAARLKAKEEARLRAEEERRRAEEAKRLRAAEEARRQAEEEARRRVAEEARLRAEEEARQKAAEVARLKAEEEARRQALEEARRKAEEEAARRQAEEEARRKAEEEARLQAEAEARRQAAEEEKRKAAEAARLKAEEEKRRQAEERLQREAEAKRQREEARRRAAEEKAAREEALRRQRADCATLLERNLTTPSDDASQMPPTIAFHFPPPAPAPPATVQVSGLTAAATNVAPAANAAGQSFGNISAPMFQEPAKPASVLPFVGIAAAVALLLGGGIFLAYNFLARDGAQSGVAKTPSGMALIEGGSIEIGRNDAPKDDPAYPAHGVSVNPFYLGKTEVTNAQYAEFLRATGGLAPVNAEDPKTYTWQNWSGTTPPAGQEDWPVRNVTVDEAVAYARWRGQRDGFVYRLPTEEEWEFAARSGSSANLYPWGREWAADIACLGERKQPCPAGEQTGGQSSAGVVDLIGNVYEWTSSTASYYAGNKSTVGAGEGSAYVYRGGAYLSQGAGPNAITAATRSWNAQARKHPLIGFRLACDAAK